MRRIVRSLAVLGAVALSACSGGGSVLNFGNNTNPDHVIITAPGQTNIARVLPGASIALSAVQVKGSQNGFVNGNTFRWSAALTTGGTYPINELGQFRPCQTVNLNAGGTTTPFTADFSIYLTIDPVNEGNVIFSPPSLIPVPTGLPPGSSITPAFPYCVTVNAEPGTITGTGLSTVFHPTGPPGSITVTVVNPQAPLG